jgi:hypothetical protein
LSTASNFSVEKAKGAFILPLLPRCTFIIHGGKRKVFFNEIGIRVGYERVTSALDVKGTIHKK